MSSLAIVEKKPPFAGAGSGCAGGVLFHLLDWHRRLARKRRLFSPRRLLPSSLRSPRKLRSPPPPPSPPPPSPPPPDGATPGVVARLMGLDSWPAGSGGGVVLRPQKQRKVEADEAAAAVVVPRRQPPPAASRHHHGLDLPARSPRRSRFVQAAAARLLEPGVRASVRASARLALAYASSSPQRSRDGGAALSSEISDGCMFQVAGSRRMSAEVAAREEQLMCSDSLPLERRIEEESVAVQSPVPSSVDATGGTAHVLWSHQRHCNEDARVVRGKVVMPRSNIRDGNFGRGGSDVVVRPKDHRAPVEHMNNCGGIRSSSNADRIGYERVMRKRGTLTRPEVANVAAVRSISSTHPKGSARRDVTGQSELVYARRMVNDGSCPRKELTNSAHAKGNARRDVIDRSGGASTSKRMTNNGSCPKRELRKKANCDAASSTRKESNTVACASSSSVKPITRASSCSKISEKSKYRGGRSSDATHTKKPLLDAKCVANSPPTVTTSNRHEFGRLLEGKIKELGLSDRNEFASNDALSGRLTASVLQELISALTKDMDSPASQNGSYSDASAPLNNDSVGCIDLSGYAVSNDQSPDFHKYYQGKPKVDSSATCMNNENNQPSPTSILEACFSNDTSSLGSPTENTEGKDLFGLENKIEDFFSLESDMLDSETSIDAEMTDTEERFHGSDKTSSLQNFASFDFGFLKARLYSIREAISNAELLLGSNFLCGPNGASGFSLHSFVIEMLETTVDVFSGSEGSLGLTEEKENYQLTNFLFDCIVESLNSKFCNFGKCGYSAWLRLPLFFSKDSLRTEICEEIKSWREVRGIIPDRVAEKELSHQTAEWAGCEVEAFDISIEIENDIIQALLDEFAFDQW